MDEERKTGSLAAPFAAPAGLRREPHLRRRRPGPTTSGVEVEGPEGLGIDGIDGFLPIDAAEAPPGVLPVVIDDRLSGLLEDVLAGLDDRGGVVLATLKPDAVDVARLVVPGGMAHHVVGRPAGRADATAA